MTLSEVNDFSTLATCFIDKDPSHGLIVRSAARSLSRSEGIKDATGLMPDSADTPKTQHGRDRSEGMGSGSMMEDCAESGRRARQSCLASCLMTPSGDNILFVSRSTSSIQGAVLSRLLRSTFL